MILVTWNIQWGKGCDGVVDLARIVDVAKTFADADVFCFQEVSEGFTALDGDVVQSAELAALLPAYTPVFRPAVELQDASGKVRRFGNMTLSRLPVVQSASHLLPWPQPGSVRSMRRQALEVTVQAILGPVRIINTHLEYYSASQRDAQIERLLDLQEEASSSPRKANEPIDPYVGQTVAYSSILCGDFNFDVSDPQHAAIDKSSRAGLNYRDAWTLQRVKRPRLPTCGLFDRQQWKSGPDCRDFIFVSEDLAGRVVQVDVESHTSASDHQPLVLELAD